MLALRTSLLSSMEQSLAEAKMKKIQSDLQIRDEIVIEKYTNMKPLLLRIESIELNNQRMKWKVTQEQMKVSRIETSVRVLAKIMTGKLDEVTRQNRHRININIKRPSSSVSKVIERTSSEKISVSILRNLSGDSDPNIKKSNRSLPTFERAIEEAVITPMPAGGKSTFFRDSRRSYGNSNYQSPPCSPSISPPNMSDEEEEIEPPLIICCNSISMAINKLEAKARVMRTQSDELLRRSSIDKFLLDAKAGYIGAMNRSNSLLKSLEEQQRSQKPEGAIEDQTQNVRRQASESIKDVVGHQESSKDLVSLSPTPSPSRQRSNFALTGGNPFTPVNMHSMFFSPRGLISNELLATLKQRVDSDVFHVNRKSTHDCFLAAMESKKKQKQKNQQLRKEIASEHYENKKEQEEEDWMRAGNYLARQSKNKKQVKNHFLFHARRIPHIKGFSDLSSPQNHLNSNISISHHINQPSLHSLLYEAKKPWIEEESQQIVGVKAMFTDLKSKYFKMQKETDFQDFKPQSLIAQSSFFKVHSFSPHQSTKLVPLQEVKDPTPKKSKSLGKQSSFPTMKEKKKAKSNAPKLHMKLLDLQQKKKRIKGEQFSLADSPLVYGTGSYSPGAFPSNTPLKYSEPTDVLSDLGKDHSKTQSVSQHDKADRKWSSEKRKNRGSDDSASTMVSDLIVAAKRDISKLFRQSKLK